MFALFIEQAFVLDLPSLVLPLHRPQHSPALVESEEFGEHRLLHQLGQLVDDIAAPAACSPSS